MTFGIDYSAVMFSGILCFFVLLYLKFFGYVPVLMAGHERKNFDRALIIKCTRVQCRGGIKKVIFRKVQIWCFTNRCVTNFKEKRLLF